MESVTQAMAVGTRYHQAGQLAEAEAVYRQVLESEPKHPHALHQLGMLALGAKQFQSAVDLIASAIQCDGSQAAFYANLGEAYRHLGKPEQAVECYQNAVRLQPGLVPAHLKLGMLLRALGRLDEAAAALHAALQLKAGDEAILSELGHTLAAQNKLSEAEACFRHVVEADPRSADAPMYLGDCLAKQELLTDSTVHYAKAIELRPDFAAAHNNLGIVLVKLERHDEAVACYRRALELEPKLAGTSMNLGSLLARQGRVAEATDVYQQALSFQPQPDAWKLAIISVCPAVFASAEEMDLYRAGLLAQVEDVSRSHPRFSLDDLSTIECRPSFNLAFHGRDDRPIREAYAKVFRDCFTGDQPAGSAGRPRIGFVVTDSHERAFQKSLGGILNRMNPDRFELVVVCSDRGAEVLRPTFWNPAIRLLPVAMEFRQVADAISAARLDVLYHWEVGTSSINYFLPFVRLAPVQCTSWGIQVTSGIPQIDFYLSSALVEGEDADSHYTEQLVLAKTLLTYQERVSQPGSPKPREYFGLARDRHLYVCAQQLGKCHPDFDPILAGILRGDSQGLVVLTEDKLSRIVVGQLRERFAATMPDVADRIVFVPFQPYQDYLSLIAFADVLLDPLHFGGVNGSYDAFSLNQPVVTLPSKFHRGRYTLGCYKKMGLTDLVASSAEHYVEIALALGTRPDFHAAMVETIVQASPALFEDMEAVREHERLFDELIAARR